MKLSINKVIKNNFFFSLLIWFLLHLLHINVSLFEYCWEEKLYWMEMKTGVGGHWINQTSFNFSDYKEYGPKNIKDIFFPYAYRQEDVLLLLLLLIVLFFCYIVFPTITMLFKKKNQKKMFIIIDSINFSIYLWCAFIGLSDKPMIGVIPIYILLPLFFCILLCFRIRQYKKKLIF